MADNILTRYETSEGIELVIDNATGESFATERGYAKMSGLSQQAINKRTSKGDNLGVIKKAEVLTPGGLQGNNLIPAKIVFKWLMSDNPELALQMGEAGATLYLQILAGFKLPQIQPIQETINPKDVVLKELLMMGIQLATAINDARALIAYNTQLQNLIQRVSGCGNQSLAPALPEMEWLTVSEVLERKGYPMYQKALKNSLGYVGKLVKSHYFIDTNNEPKLIEKLVGTNHRPTEVKLYPSDYFERINEIATDYWDSKSIKSV